MMRRETVETVGIGLFVRMVGNFARLLRWSGLVAIVGKERFHATLKSGSVIIAANHPSMLETLLVPVIAFPELMHDHALMPWSIADVRVFPRMLRWLYPFLRMITIDRMQTKHTAKGLHRAMSILRARGAVTIYPEGGRTSKGIEFVYSACMMYRIRKIEPTLCEIAQKTRTAILPVWVEFDVSEALWFTDALIRALRGSRMTIRVGNPYCVVPGTCPLDAARDLEQYLLHIAATGP